MAEVSLNHRVYGRAHALYRDAGWAGVLTIPAGQKHPPPNGYTGRNGRWPTTIEMDAWATDRADWNIAIRVPHGVVGIDVDNYGTKRGGDTLTTLESLLGALPRTWRSTSRPDDSLSGIRWYQVPTEREFHGKVEANGTSDIEVIQYHHRFAVVWPSIHPEGRTYVWFNPSGEIVDSIPVPHRLPELPPSWVEYLSNGTVQDQVTSPPPDLNEARTWLTEGEPCPIVTTKLDEYSNEGGSRHDTVVGLQVALLGLGEQGHRGVDQAIEILREQFITDVTGDGSRTQTEAEYEWQNALHGAPGSIRDRTTPENRHCCPTDDLLPDDAWDLSMNRHQTTGPESATVVANTSARSPDGRHWLNVSNPDHAANALRDWVGRLELAGIFRRNGELVHTPRVGEEGYEEPEEKGVDLGPAQVRVMTAAQLKALVGARIACYIEVKDKNTGKMGPSHRLCPRDVINDVYESARMGEKTPYLRELLTITHTPVLRPDGSVLDQPGYDTSTKTLYLPDNGLSMPPVPDRPTAEQIRQATELFLTMTAEFPFVHLDHRATWCGLAFTPLLRPLLPPPYQMGVATAPNPGSGKGFLIGMLRSLHGGVLRGELPKDAEELRKQITSTLVDTTAPVVQFDNLSGVVRSSVMEALLTTASWSDRHLGHNQILSTINDRLWVATGNNASIGGDLARRTVFMEIDPHMPNPHLRTGFKIHPPTWVPRQRGELLTAMLTIARGWVLAGAPTKVTRSDDYQNWSGALAGLLAWAEIPGMFGGEAQAQTRTSDDDREWAEWLAALYGVFGNQPFTIAEVCTKLRESKEAVTKPDNPEIERVLDPSLLPGDLADHHARSSFGRDGGFRKRLGWWFKNRAGRYAAGWKVTRTGEDRTLGAVRWAVDPPA